MPSALISDELEGVGLCCVWCIWFHVRVVSFFWSILTFRRRETGGQPDHRAWWEWARVGISPAFFCLFSIYAYICIQQYTVAATQGIGTCTSTFCRQYLVKPSLWHGLSVFSESFHDPGHWTLNPRPCLRRLMYWWVYSLFVSVSSSGPEMKVSQD